MDMNIIKLKVHNNQEAFDAAVRHLNGMRRRAATADARTCVYETEDGKANCVVGALLVLDTPDKHKWAKKVRASVENVLRGTLHRSIGRGDGDRPGEYLVDENGVDPGLLARLQSIHDDKFSWSPEGFVGWGRLRAGAAAFDLNTKALDALRR